VGFGWTNGVYLEMNDLLTHKKNQMPSRPKTSHPEPAAAPQ
jgi:hypothetical protein